MNTYNIESLFKRQIKMYGKTFLFNNESLQGVVFEQDKKLITSCSDIVLYDTFIYQDEEYIVTSKKSIEDIYYILNYEKVLNYLTFNVNDELINIPCITKDTSVSLSNADSIILLNNSLKVKVKKNNITVLPRTNDRFWVYDCVWKLTSISWQDEGCYIYYFDIDVINTATDNAETRTTGTVYEMSVYYNLTLTDDEHCTLTSNPLNNSPILRNTQITINCDYDAGYELDVLKVNDVDVTPNDNTYTFTLLEDTTVSLTSKPIQQTQGINVSWEGENSATLQNVNKTDTTYSCNIKESKKGTFTFTNSLTNDGTGIIINTISGDTSHFSPQITGNTLYISTSGSPYVITFDIVCNNVTLQCTIRSVGVW